MIKLKSILLGLLFCSVAGISRAQQYLDQDVVHTVLWKISGNDLSVPCFLFGTQHDQPFEIFQSKYPQLDSVLSLADRLIVENVPEEGASSLDEDLLFFSGKDSTIKDLLKPGQYKRLAYYLHLKTRNNPEVFDRLIKMRPQLLLMAIPYLAANEDDPDTGQVQMLDQGVVALASNGGKKILGLEDAHERSLALLEVIKDKAAIQQMMRSINGSTARLKHDKKKGAGPRKVGTNTRGFTDRYEDLWIHYFFNRSIKGHDYGAVVYRNGRWMQKIPYLLEQGGQLIFVGLDHLKGREGLIQQLLGLGYQVEPVNMGVR